MAIRATINLLSNVGAVGNGAAQGVNLGGSYQLTTNGTFAGTSFKMQVLGPDNVNWIDYPNTTFAVAGVANLIDLPIGAQVRGVLTGGAPAAFYAALNLYRRSK